VPVYSPGFLYIELRKSVMAGRRHPRVGRLFDTTSMIESWSFPSSLGDPAPVPSTSAGKLDATGVHAVCFRRAGLCQTNSARFSFARTEAPSMSAASSFCARWTEPRFGAGRRGVAVNQERDGAGPRA